MIRQLSIAATVLLAKSPVGTNLCATSLSSDSLFAALEKTKQLKTEFFLSIKNLRLVSRPNIALAVNGIGSTDDVCANCITPNRSGLGFHSLKREPSVQS